MTKSLSYSLFLASLLTLLLGARVPVLAAVCLVVELATDYEPFVEFDAVETRFSPCHGGPGPTILRRVVFGERGSRSAIAPADSYRGDGTFLGIRIAGADGFEKGCWRVDVRLLDGRVAR